MPSNAAPPAASDSEGDEATPLPGKAGVAMDWEDDEESTHVFEKQKHGFPPRSTKVGNAAALATSGTARMPSVPAPPAVPPQPPVPAPLPPPPRVPVEATPVRNLETPGRFPSMPRIEDQPRQGGGTSKLGVILGGLALVAVIALGVFMFMPRTGQLKIDLKSKSGAPVARAEIFVDGQKKCDTSPCIVDDLSPGRKAVKVISPNGNVSDATESVEAGKEKVVFITIDDGGSTTSPTPSVSQSAEPVKMPAGTGIKLDGQPGLRVFIDGQERGVTPIALTDLKPGDLKLKLDGGDRYEAFEKTVTVAKNEIVDMSNTKLKVVKGRITMELRTTGAQVLLSSVQNGKKVEKKLGDAVWASQPVKLDIEVKDQWKILATKKGFQDYAQDISFDDGQAERAVTIELVPVGAPATTTPTTPPTGQPSLPATGTPKQPATSTPVASAAPKETPKGNGTININSIPVSKVVLDGRPLGSTPQVGISVPAGPHTVTFIHPEKGRKSKTVTVKPGETATAAVKFD